MDQHVVKIVQGTDSDILDPFTFVLEEDAGTSVTDYLASEVGSGYGLSWIDGRTVVTLNPDA